MTNNQVATMLPLRPLITVAVVCFSGMCASCKTKDVVIYPGDNKIITEGRVMRTPTQLDLFWSGSSIRLRFEGTAVTVDLEDEKGLNYYYVIVDGKVKGKLHPVAGKGRYAVVEALKKGPHLLELYRLTEESHGKTTFLDFDLGDGGKLLDPPMAKKHRIEFYGNSLTAGYSLEDTVADSRDPVYFNNYKSYAAITARHFNAEWSCIAKSGIGVTVSWFPVIMPELYDRLDPANPDSKWDFERFTPELVVVNLFSNDLQLIYMPEHEQFKARFGGKRPGDAYFVDAYTRFIAALRGKYPDAYILCTLDAWKDPESDGHRFPRYIRTAVDQLGDARIGYFFFNYQRKKPRFHPKEKDHIAMADELCNYIHEKLNW